MDRSPPMPVMPFTRSPEDPLEALATTLVGRVDLDRTRARVCRAMLREALRRTGGNYTHAAALLGVKRQAVQQMVRRLELEVWTTALKDKRVAVEKRTDSTPQRRSNGGDTQVLKSNPELPGT